MIDSLFKKDEFTGARIRVPWSETMSKNERLYKILDRMFPGDPSFYQKYYCRDSARGEDWHELKRKIFDNLDDAFWLANKVLLLKKYLLHQSPFGWEILDIRYVEDATIFEAVASGDDPQEAIINAIISIHGESACDQK